jgi:hypothetical protein
MIKRLRASVAAAACVGLVAWASTGLAETTASAEDISTARTLAKEGVALQDSGDCVGALGKYEKAEAIYHTPSVLTRLGECQIKLGKLVAGSESLQRVVREQLPANAPPAFVQAQAHAKELLDATLPRIGKLKLHVDAPEGAQLTLKIDGAVVSTASLDTDRAADPGAHVVEVSGPGLVTAKGNVEVGEGLRATLSLKITRESSTTKPKTKAPDEPDEPETTPAKKPKHVDEVKPDDDDDEEPTRTKRKRHVEEPAGPSRVAPIVMFVTAGVGIGVGTVFGLRASGLKGDLDKVCLNKECPPSASGNIDSMKSSATISTIGFGVGIAALAVGTFLWITGGSSESSKPAHAYVEPMIGFGFIGVRGAL